MARETRQSLAYTLEHIIRRRLVELKVGKVASIVNDVVPRIIETLPDQTFEPASAFDAGILLYRGEITDLVSNEIEQQLHSAHLTLAKDKPITLTLSSVGGEVPSGLSVVSTIQHLRREGRRVNVHVSGVALSMAAVILQAATWRTIEPHAFLLLHNSRYEMPQVPLHEHEDTLAFNKRLDAVMDAMFVARTGKTLTYYRQRQERRDWYVSATEALSEHLVDQIVRTPSYPKHKPLR